MLGDKVGSMTLQETSKPIDSGKYGLPAMETHNKGAGTLLAMMFMRKQLSRPT